MADTKITALTALTGADPANDVIPIVDVSDTTMAASGTTKKISVNNILGASGTATLASATITGALAANADTTLGTASKSTNTNLNLSSDLGTQRIYLDRGTRSLVFQDVTSSIENYRIAGITGVHTWGVGGSTAMTLNSTGLGVGASPSHRLTVSGTAATNTTGLGLIGTTTGYNRVLINNTSGGGQFGVEGSSGGNLCVGSTAYSTVVGSYQNYSLHFITNNNVQATIDTSGNVGIGVQPSAWAAGWRAAQVGSRLVLSVTGSDTFVGNNWYSDGAYKFINADYATYYDQTTGKHVWGTSTTSGAVNGVITWNPAMTLDASGNLLVGVTSGTSNVIKKTLTPDAGNVVLDVYGNNTSATFYSVSAFGANAANAAVKTGKDNVTSRSINSGGTINASGADYAEYLTKGSDFVLAKGDIAGIDTNGKLTNVFADAVSFVVKSTDPSYVGNDKWGVGLEGDALEAARQLVDRIAFAGQVPVNVTGAKAGDYIVPVVDGTGIKGIAVSNPTFEQYQLAVGKVIAIDADGRARIIVKVA